MSEQLTKSAFARHEKSTFTLASNGEPQSLVLMEVADLSSDPENDESFSLLFHATGPGLLGQGLYQLNHQEMGSQALFLVPVDADESGAYYEAVFNRKVKNSLR